MPPKQTLLILYCFLFLLFTRLPATMAQAPRLHVFTSGNVVYIDTLLPHSASPVAGRRPAAASRTASPYAPAGSIQLNVVTTPSSCGYFNGSISVIASGGTPPYTYSFNGGPFQSYSVFVGTGTANYSIDVQDAAGLIASTTATIVNNHPQAAVSAYSVVPSGCATSDGSVTIVATGGTPPYQYSMDLVNFQSGNVFNNLSRGLYYFHVKDASGCISSTLSAVNLESYACSQSFGGSYTYLVCNNEGFISMSMYYGTPPYQYSLDGVNYQSSPNFYNLTPGLYTLYAKDAAGKQYSITLNMAHECFPKLNVTETDASCGSNSGTITAVYTNGTPPYQYSLDGVNFQNSNVFTGLAPGAYTVVAKDAAGFINVGIAPVNGGCLAVTAAAVNASCGNNNGTITATGSGGVPPYSYSLDGVNFQTGNTFNGLGAGAYTLTIKDAGGNTATAGATITNTQPPSFTATVSGGGCSSPTGLLSIYPSGGTPPYQYSVDGINYQAGSQFFLSPGPYSIWVKDANGCVATSAGWTIPVGCLQSTIYLRNASCNANDATITIVASGGTPPYQFSINGGSLQTSNLFTNLGAGRVTVLIQDAAGLSYTVTFSIHHVCFTIIAAVVNATCGLNNGSITAAFNGTSPTLPVQFSIDGVNFQAGSTFTGLAPGTYTVMMKDANGFTGDTTATVGNTPAPQISAQAATATCANNDGSITIAAGSGTTPFQYSINGTSYQSSPGFAGLASGSYIAMVKDANGCIASQPVSIALNNTLWVNAGNVPTICEGDAITLNAGSNGTAFSWLPATGLSNAATLDPVASPAASTQYTVTATLGGCRATGSVLVTVYPAPVANAGADTAICYGQSIPLNGSGGMSYAWYPSTYLDNASLPAPVCNKPTGSISYQLTVTDANHCRSIKPAVVTITVTPPPNVFAGRDTSVYINQPVQLNATDINNSGFTQYSWSPAYGLSNPYVQNPVATVNQTTTYEVVASTPNGCESTGTVSIKVFMAVGIFVPNAFTPNGDGHNDLLRALPMGIREFKYFAVFNRWGQRIFYTTNATNGWDGTINGKPQDTGVYAWIAAGINYKGDLIERRGTVILVR